MTTLDEGVSVDRAGIIWAVKAVPGKRSPDVDVFVNGQKMLDVIEARVIDPRRSTSFEAVGSVLCHVRDSSGGLARSNGEYVTIWITGAVEIVRKPT